jgi:hypothetical protein
MGIGWRADDVTNRGPLEWVGTGNKPIIEVCSDWGAKTSLESEGLIAKSRWWVTSLREMKETNSKVYRNEVGFYGFVTNDDHVAKRILSNEKAFSYVRFHLPPHNPSHGQLDQFQFKYVFKDAFGYHSDQILVYDKGFIDERILQSFLSMLERYGSNTGG